MIEKVSGMSYRDYVRQNIFAKARMSRSDFLRLDRVHEDVAEGSDPIQDEGGSVIGWKKNMYSFPPIGSPDSGAFVTAHDLDAFLRSVEAGELLSAELTTAFFSPHVHYREIDNLTMMYGYGLWFDVDKSGSIVCSQKEGVNAGASGLIRNFPALDVNVVLLSNLEEGVWQPIREIHDLILSREVDL
jgi:CubicO group peptidase (beta-lactamase class C family)